MASASSSSIASMAITCDIDLDALIQKIDSVLSQISCRQGKSHRETFTFSDMIQPASADVAKLLEGLSQGAKLISDQKTLWSNSLDLSAEARKTAAAVLKQIGNLHWAAAGFLVVASVLERFEKISRNKKQCLNVLRRSNDLAKCLKVLKERSGLVPALNEKAEEAFSYIVQGAIMCDVQRRMSKLSKCLLTSKNREDLDDFDREISHFHDNLSLLLNATNVASTPTEFSPSSTALGIEDQVEKVIECLDFQSDKPAIAVVVCGIGGIGKSTIADTVFHRLQQRKDYKTCMVVLNENDDPNLSGSVETLQAQILKALTNTKQEVPNYKTGQKEIKTALHSTKEAVLLYIDNVLKREYVKKILPERLDSPHKFRLLLTSRKSDVEKTVKSRGIDVCEVYEIKPLAMKYRIDIICRDLGANIGDDEKRTINQIAEKCSGIPLVLEVVGGYLRQTINSKMELDQTFQRVLQALEKGEPFSCNTEDMEYESKLMFAYDALDASAKDAFLDISIFFRGWNWDEVGCIVGEEELRALEEGALVKRIEDRTNVHDVLVGISRKKSKNTRITSTKQLSDALQDQKITGEIKGIWLRHHGKLYSDLSAEMLDKMYLSLRVLSFDGWTMIKGICKARFENLRFLQAKYAANLPIDISMLDQQTRELKFLDNDSWQHIGLDTPSQILSTPSTLKLLRLRGGKLEIPPQFLSNSRYLRSLEVQSLASLFELPESFTQLTNLVDLDLSFCTNLCQLPKRLGDLIALQKLNLMGCKGLTQLPERLGDLIALQKLNLIGCKGLTQLPERLGDLIALQKLNLKFCEGLTQLPERLGDLIALQKLNLIGCKGLTQLPERLGDLIALQKLNLRFCEGLTQLPETIGELQCLKILTLADCRNVKQLPESFCSLSSLQDLDLSGCDGITIYSLPSSFDELSSLRYLDLSYCNNLEHLPTNLGNLASLVQLNIESCHRLLGLPSSIGKLKSLSNTLKISGCYNLEGLPEEFCDLNLETLKLEDFWELQRLPDRFMELTTLKHLSLKSCKSLVRLPVGFGKLPVLEELNLESCIKLRELASDFHSLPSLKKLILSRCVELDGLWMETVVKVSSLDFVEISGSCRLEDRWLELRENEDWEILVHTDKDHDEDGRILKKAASMFFSDECSLFDCRGTPFKPSALDPNTTLVLVFVSLYISEERWKQLMENIQGLLKDCIDFQIIYAKQGFSVPDASIQESMKRLNGTILGLSCDYSKLRVAFDTLLRKLIGSNYNSYEDYVIMTTVVDKDGGKQFSEWKNITNLLEESKSMRENYLRLQRLQEVPQDGNTEILRSLLVTEGKDFLLLGNSKQVSIDSLQGKVVLLLVSKVEISQMEVLALKEMYTTAPDKHNFEIVWMPIGYNSAAAWSNFVRSAESMPWPATRDPWSIEPAALKVVKEDWKFRWDPKVVVVDEKGIICNKNVKRTVERWGMEAYPFSEDQIQKLRMEQWDHIKAKSTLEVLFEKFDCFEQVKKSMLQGQLICLYGGDPWQISDFTSKLSSFAVSDAVQLIYVGRKQEVSFFPENLILAEEARHERNRQGMRWLSLSYVEAWKFWNQIEDLLEDLRAEEYPESLQKYRVSLDILCQNNNERSEGDVWMTVVDQSGEVVRAQKREEVLSRLQWSEKEGSEIVMQAISCGEVEQSPEE